MRVSRTLGWSSADRKGTNRVTMFASRPRVRNAARSKGLIDVPVIHGRLRPPRE